MSLSKTLYPHCFSRLSCKICTRWGQPRKGVQCYELLGGIALEITFFKWSRNRSHLPWLSPILKNCIKKKHRLMQLAKKTGMPSDGTKSKQHKSITPKLVRQAYWNYVNAIMKKSLEHGNNKPFWKYIKARHNYNIGVAANKNNGILYHDSKTKAKLSKTGWRSRTLFAVNRFNYISFLAFWPSNSYPSDFLVLCIVYVLFLLFAVPKLDII